MGDDNSGQTEAPGLWTLTKLGAELVVSRSLLSRKSRSDTVRSDGFREPSDF
jgi:hypothetical protein